MRAAPNLPFNYNPNLSSQQGGLPPGAMPAPVPGGPSSPLPGVTPTAGPGGNLRADLPFLNLPHQSGFAGMSPIQRLTALRMFTPASNAQQSGPIGALTPLAQALVARYGNGSAF